MNKILGKLFLTNVTVVLGCLIFLWVFLRIPGESFFFIAAVTILTGSVLSVVMWKIFLKPIKQMKKVTEKITRGDFGGRFFLARTDELGELAHNLEQMSFELQSKLAEISSDKNELKAILSSMEEGVVVIGKDERIILMNPPVFNMLDLRSSNAIGRPYWEVIRNDEINSLLKEAITHKKSLRKEIMVITPQESHFGVQVSSILAEKGTLGGVVAVFHDITELKRLARLRSEFVANVSHELKTPLTSIKGFVETLKDGAINDPQNARKFLDIIQKHTERLENLVNDTLSLSALESKDMELNFERVPIALVVESVISLCKDRIESSKHNVSLDVAIGIPLVSIDRAKMEQVFLNLLDNAIKFTPPGGSIKISIYPENDFVRVDVKDSGIGIEEQYMPRIFERFYRVDQGRSRDMGGTGLGLSIVKHILQVHNGKVSVRSDPGKGSIFSVFLPIVSIPIKSS